MWRRRVLHEEHGNQDAAASPGSEATFVEIDPARLSRVIAVPAWLRDLGLMSWLLVTRDPRRHGLRPTSSATSVGRW